jgi:hypothetical protein
MKKHLLYLTVILSCLIMCERAQAGVYIFGTFGNGGEVDADSYGGEIGAIWPSSEPKYLIGLGMSYANSSKSESATFLLDEVRAPEYDIYVAGGFNLAKGFFITGTAGFSETCEGTVFKGDDPSDCISYDNNDVSYKFTGSGQLRFVYEHLMLGVGYHNRRGVVGGIGVSF